MSEKPIFRMSSAGKCPRALSAQRLGYPSEPAPEWLERAANEGKMHEDWIIEQLWEECPVDRQLEVVLDYPTFTLVGHIDGKLAIEPQKPKLLEIKTMGQYEFDRWMRGGWKEFPQYADQLTCYMAATGLEEAVYIVKNRSSGYIDRFIQRGCPSILDDIIIKLQEVELAVQAGQLVEVEYNPTSIECRRCEFHNTLCLVSKEQLAEATEKELLAAIDTWRKGKGLEAEAKALIEEGRKVLEEHAEAASPDAKFSYVIGGVQVARYSVHDVRYPRKELELIVPEELLVQVRKEEDRWQCRITDTEAKDD